MNRLRQLVFPYGFWEKSKDGLFTKEDTEGFAFGLARPYKRGKGILYFVEHLFTAEKDDYEFRGNAGLTMTDITSSRFNVISVEAAKFGLIPVHVHSHPDIIKDFSGYDDEQEQELHNWLQSNGQPFLWSVVHPSKDEPKARLWRDGNFEYGQVRAGLQPFGTNEVDVLPALDRQRVFGNAFRDAAAHLRIGVVGLGGIGLPVVEQLTRCGFIDFVLIDHDKIETANLNRLQGAIQKDIGRFKVQLARSIILKAGHSIGTSPRVRIFQDDIYLESEKVRKKLHECDVILALTDNEISRVTCLQIAFEGWAEYLQAGVNIRLNQQGKIDALFTEVTGAEKGRYCPLCTKRLDSEQINIEARRYIGGDVWEHAQKEGYVSGITDPSVMSLNAITAGATVMEIQRRVSGLGVRDLWQMDFQNGKLITIEHIEQHLEGECNVCGRRQSS